jgi:tetratricopeptide (TPR) repeat protein
VRRLDLALELGTAIQFSGDLPQAEETLEIVAAGARAAGNRRIELRAEVELFYPRWSSGRLTGAAALELIGPARSFFEAASDELGVARASHLEAVIHSEAGRAAEAEAAGGRALLFYRRAGFPAEFGSSLLAGLLMKGPVPVDEAIRRCRELLGEIVTPGWRSFVLPSLACLEAMRGEFNIAREHLEDARLGRREWGEPTTLAMDWAHQAAWVELLAGDPPAAERVLIEACEALRRIGVRPWLSTNLGLLATAVIEQGRFDDGLGLASEAASLALPDDQIAQILWRRAQAKALAAGGKLARADRLAREAVAIRDDSDMLNDRAESLVVLAEVLGSRGKTIEAAETLEQARTLFEAKGNVVAADRTRVSLLALSG